MATVGGWRVRILDQWLDETGYMGYLDWPIPEWMWYWAEYSQEAFA